MALAFLTGVLSSNKRILTQHSQPLNSRIQVCSCVVLCVACACAFIVMATTHAGLPSSCFYFAFRISEEGKGALALSIEAANAAGADIILANDPDADRLAVAERIPTHLRTTSEKSPNPADEWRIFTGNEIGTLLGCWQWANNQNSSQDGDYLATTFVFNGGG